jgi:hypothetical protein
MIRRHFEIGDLPAKANTRDAAPLCADADEFRRIARAETTYPHSDEGRDTRDEHLEESASQDQHHPSIHHPITDAHVVVRQWWSLRRGPTRPRGYAKDHQQQRASRCGPSATANAAPVPAGPARKSLTKETQ